jgi:type II secretory pathway component PulF
LIEPMLIAFVGIIVGGILLSIIAPIYQLIGQISPNNY